MQSRASICRVRSVNMESRVGQKLQALVGKTGGKNGQVEATVPCREKRLMLVELQNVGGDRNYV